MYKIFFVLFIVLTSLLTRAQSSLKFNGSSSYVRSANTTPVRLTQFTLECWFYLEGNSATTSTGSGGVTAIPLITRGRGEAEQASKDVNYFLGIRTDSLLTADFENNTNSANHPVSGVTKVKKNKWQHAAVTYNGSTWKLYLNGVLDKTLTVSRTPQSGSLVNLSFGASVNSTNTPEGFFNGKMDEIRIWNTARTDAQIASAYLTEIPSAAGLVGRWGFNENTGTTAANSGSGGTALNGTLINSPVWSVGYQSGFNTAPVISNPNPANGVLNFSGTQVCVDLADAENNPMAITTFGRLKPVPTTGADFTAIFFPDTQFYTSELNGGTNAILKSQCDWTVANKNALNIVYVNQLGDCVEHGDNSGNDIEWKRADTAYKKLEDPVTTSLTEGIPYGICVGNHDQSPQGNPLGTTTFYNQYFGQARFQGRSYYGGHFGSNNDNSYQLFSASGVDFINISLEYAETITANTSINAAVIKWADSLLKVHSNRKAIITSHWLINADASWSGQGKMIYDSLKDNRNLFLMVCGHIPGGEAMRSDTYNDNTIITVLSDYQSWPNGGNGYLRIFNFSPANSQAQVKTFSTTLNMYETDANSQFTIPYFHGLTDTFNIIGSTGGLLNGTACQPWANLLPDVQYEWYVKVNDAVNETLSPVWNFRAAAPALINKIQVIEDPKKTLFLADNNDVHVYPNPTTNNNITIGLPNKVAGDVIVRIMDLNGNSMYRGKFNKTQNSVNVECNWPKGIYIVNIMTGEKQQTKKIIIN
jgi:Concanavalin A-like lectin/glucanases superfamily/Secretion system C-terminal sorting domain/Calcineurin-like phosphoesterase